MLDNADYTIGVIHHQGDGVRCPRHTIQFLGYGYGRYIEKTLELLSINRASLDWRKYGSWTPFGDGEGWH